MKKNLILSLMAIMYTFSCYGMSQQDSVENINVENINVENTTINNQAEVKHQFREAVNNSNFSQIRNLLNCYSKQPNLAYPTLLHFVVKKSKKDIVNSLINLGFNVNAKNKLGQTALHIAAIKNNLQIARALVKCNANVNIKDNRGSSPLNYAHDLRLIKFLVEAGANINDQNLSSGFTPLHMAVNNMSLSKVKYLISKNADVTIQDEYGYTPLFFRQYSDIGDNKKIVDIARCLLAGKNGINIRNKLGETPLYNAIKLKFYNLAKLFLENKCNTNLRDVKGNTVLNLAIKMGIPFDLIKLIVENGARVDSENDNGITPLLAVIEKNNNLNSIDLVRLFLKYPEVTNKIFPALEKVRLKIKNATNRDEYDDFKCIEDLLLEHMKVYSSQGLISTSGINGGYFDGKSLPILPLDVLSHIASSQFVEDSNQNMIFEHVLNVSEESGSDYGESSDDE